MKAIVVEDSRLAREGLVRMLSNYPHIEIVGQADTVDSALALVKQWHPELLFLDIHLPGNNSFALLEQLDYLPKVVFTTAYSDYAIRSFEFNTIDYLLKPISQARLEQAVVKLLAAPDAEPDHDSPATRPAIALDADSKIFVKDGEQCHLIDLKDILYIESCKNYVQLFFGQQHAFVKKTMNAVEERLPRSLFFRASRQHIVNLRHIVRIEESISDGYMVRLSNGQELEISRRQASELKELLSL